MRHARLSHYYSTYSTYITLWAEEHKIKILISNSTNFHLRTKIKQFIQKFYVHMKVAVVIPKKLLNRVVRIINYYVLSNTIHLRIYIRTYISAVVKFLTLKYDKYIVKMRDSL